MSRRSAQPFIAVNCGAIPMSLMESELFGYEGAFTGAAKSGKPGMFELAHKGTLLLDEIGELPLPMQAKLLQVLDGHPFHRVGGTKPIVVDVRVIAATNKPLAKMVEAGHFREDLSIACACSRSKSRPCARGRTTSRSSPCTSFRKRSKKTIPRKTSTRRCSTASSPIAGPATCASCARSSSRWRP
ncbi:MAG: sigma-54 factor interaction domain-containing protein [Bilophila sp.]